MGRNDEMWLQEFWPIDNLTGRQFVYRTNWPKDKLDFGQIVPNFERYTVKGTSGELLKRKDFGLFF